MRILWGAVALALASLAPLAVAPPAYAAGGETKDAKPDAERFIEAEHIITPVLRNGRLTNYLFVTVRVDLPDQGDVWKLRARSHFLRDALLRATHRASLSDAKDERKLDQTAALAAFRAAAVETLGANGVKAVSITAVQSLN
ncbi:MAG: hypothetical protein KJS97_02320 [Alphaproteobacteria bacterium]|nr:hypothetical protein [Alphaproteobacteria bacterium]